MNTSPFLCLIWLSASFLTEARGQLISSEPFTGLTVGNGIAGTSVDAFGWSSEWAGTGLSDSRFQIVSPVPSLSYQVAGGGLIQGGSRAIQLSTAPEPVPASLSVLRTFPNQNTTIFGSFLMRFPTSGTGSDQIEIRLLRSSTTLVTIRFNPTNPSPPVGMLWILNPGGGRGFVVPGDGLQTHLVVFELRPNGYSAWINPTYGSYGNPSASGGPGSAAGFDGLALGIESTDSAGPTTSVVVDEFRLGFTWGDVVPPPPPPTLVPALEIAPAVNLRWQSQAGKTYQVQYSYDMSTWFNFGTTISGNGQIKEVFDSPANSGAKKFFRVQIL